MEARRQFILKGASVVAAGAAASVTGPTVLIRRAAAADKTLKILQWAHFVSAYDEWFEPWAKAWGAAKGMEVTVDHVGFADVVPPRHGRGRRAVRSDVHMFLGLASAFEEHVVDLGTWRAVSRRYGEQVDLARRST